jgi:hypothetical protein
MGEECEEVGKRGRGKKVKITIYWYAGKFLWKEITETCDECDLTIALARRLVREIGEEKVELEVKPWLDHFFEALFHLGWHAPIVLVNGKRFSQGVVPDPEKLRERILTAMG